MSSEKCWEHTRAAMAHFYAKEYDKYATASEVIRRYKNAKAN